MIRQMVCLLAAAVTLAWAGSAFAFEPISFNEVPGLVGKPVFAGGNVALRNLDVRPEKWVYAGEPLTVVSAEPKKRPEGVMVYSFIRVRTEAGDEGEVDLDLLSKAPLHFNLRNPGTARQLALAVFADAFELPAKMHEIRINFQYDIASPAQADESHQVDSMQEAFKFDRGLLYGLVYGEHAKDNLLRDGATKWVATASDETILDWYSEGIKDKKIKANLVGYYLALNDLGSVSDLDFYIGRLNKDKADKLWSRGLNDIPADKLEKLDAEKISKIDQEIQKHQKQIKDSFAQAAAFKKHAK